MDQETKRNEMILNYLAKLARAMICNGATVEHTKIAVKKNAETYELDVSICFHDHEGKTYMKQLTFQSGSIDLEKRAC